MFVLTRRISMYTGPDVLLGLFTTREQAENAKAHYAKVREANPADDPWKEQAYKPDMVVSHDLEVEQIPGEFPNGSVVFVVSNHLDAMGQVVRELDSIHATATLAAARVEEINAIVVDDDYPFPHYAVIDQVAVGSLHSDLREDQPRPAWQKRPYRAQPETGLPRRLFRDV